MLSSTLTEAGDADVHLMKYNRAGTLLWERTYDHAGMSDYGVQLAITQSDEIVVAAAVSAPSGVDFGVIKYDPDGAFMWASSWDGAASGIDVPADLTLSQDDAIYLVGGSQGSTVFSDYAMVKFDWNGGLDWSSTYDHAGLHDAATGVELTDGSLVVIGASASTTTNWDYASLKLELQGGAIVNEERVEVEGVGLDNATAVTTDAASNIYITGYVEVNGNKNIQTIKVNSDFGLEWVKTFDGGLEDVARAIGVDDFGNVYITGHTGSPTGAKYVTIKYASDGTEAWNKTYAAVGDGNAKAQDLAVSGSGEVIVTGAVEKEGSKEFATVRYDAEGKVDFVKTVELESTEGQADHITIDGDNVYVSGVSEEDGELRTSTIKYSVVHRDESIAELSDGSHCIANELVVRFDPGVVSQAAASNKQLLAGAPEKFLTPSAVEELAGALGVLPKKLTFYKVFERLTPDITYSISRLGHEVPMPEYWSTFLVKFNDPVNVEAVQLQVEGIEDMVLFAEPNYIGYLLEVPNDDLYVAGQEGLYDENAGIEVETAWDIQDGTEAAKVGIYDSGINWDHEDFGNGTAAGSKIVGGWDFVSNTDIFSTEDHDENGHGTACAGVIGALRNNGLGGAGVAGGDVEVDNTGAQLFSIKISNTGFVTHATIGAAIIEGAAFNPDGNFGYGLHVQNHSWHTSNNSNSLRNAVKSCWRNGCLLVAASGNAPDPICASVNCTSFPSSYPDAQVLKVGANDVTGTNAEFSVIGSGIDLIAPGVDALYVTTDHDDEAGYGFDGDGTSFAAPHAAGVAALLISQHTEENGYPNRLAPEDLEFVLQETATDVNAEGYDAQSGHGRINAVEALELVEFPEAFILHSGGQESPSTTVVANQNVIVQSTVENVAAGWYNADRHQVTCTFIDILDVDQTVVDFWPRMSSSVGVSAVNPITGAGWYQWTPSITDNVAVFTTTTFCWFINSNSGGQYIGEWIPAPPSQLRTDYSMLINDASPSNIDDLDANGGISVFPNPTQDRLVINYDLPAAMDVTVSIVDAQGKRVLNQVLNQQHQGSHTTNVNVANLAKGTYLAQVTYGDHAHTTQFVKH